MGDSTVPSVGAHYGVPYEEYRDWDAVSQSTVKKMRHGKTPKHMKYGVVKPDTQAQALGDAVHCNVLTPEIFSSKFVQEIPGDGRTKAVKAARAEQAAQFPGAKLLKVDDFEACYKTAQSIRTHPYVSLLLDGAKTEVSVAFMYMDVLCKARMDIVSPSGTIVADIKTTRDASEEAFAKDIYKYGYHIQAPWYIVAANAAGIPARAFAVIAAEKEEPYELMVYKMSGDIIDDGLKEMKFLLAKYSECQKDDDWYGYPEEPVEINMLSWARKKIEDIPTLLM